MRLDPERRGYLLDGVLREGFEDDPSLEQSDRLRIARWGGQLAPERLSPVQLRLLESPEGRPQVSRAQRELAHNQEELASTYLAALYRLLDEEQRALVAEPDGEGYPLSVGDMHRLTGQSERQIRKWADDGLLPSFREGGGRRFYSAALIRAFALAGASTNEKALLRQAARGEVGHFLLLIAATFGRAAEDLPPDPARGLWGLVAELAHSGDLMADLDPSGERVLTWERLARERLSGPEHPRPDLVISTVPRPGRGWAVEAKGRKRALSLHHTKSEAREQARRVAKERGALYRELRLDGTVAEEKSYS